MEKQCLYLVTVLIEFSDCVSDNHALFASLEDATKRMNKEIEEAKENFNMEHGEYLHKLPRLCEWSDEDGGGFTIGIEEITPQ